MEQGYSWKSRALGRCPGDQGPPATDAATGTQSCGFTEGHENLLQNLNSNSTALCYLGEEQAQLLLVSEKQILVLR